MISVLSELKSSLEFNLKQLKEQRRCLSAARRLSPERAGKYAREITELEEKCAALKKAIYNHPESSPSF